MITNRRVLIHLKFKGSFLLSVFFLLLDHVKKALKCKNQRLGSKILNVTVVSIDDIVGIDVMEM